MNSIVSLFCQNKSLKTRFLSSLLCRNKPNSIIKHENRGFGSVGYCRQLILEQFSLRKEFSLLSQPMYLRDTMNCRVRNETVSSVEQNAGQWFNQAFQNVLKLTIISWRRARGELRRYRWKVCLKDQVKRVVSQEPGSYKCVCAQQLAAGMFDEELFNWIA